MQQTEKYQLNLIERDDVFSPDALNENAQKTEAALAAEETARAAADAALADVDAELKSMIEAKHIVAGPYIGDGTESQLINLGFKPILVIFPNPMGGAYTPHLLMVNHNPTGGLADLDPSGFRVRGTKNANNIAYDFVAFG